MYENAVQRPSLRGPLPHRAPGKCDAEQALVGMFGRGVPGYQCPRRQNAGAGQSEAVLLETHVGRIEVMLIVFDVLAIDGRDTTRRPYWERRQLLEDLALDGDWSTTSSHADGEALWEKVCELALEGVVTKKRSGHYLPGWRGWVKTKNRAYWRYSLEVEAALTRR